MSQPEYQCVGHIGDVDPIAFGGGFVYVDTTGKYPPRMEYFEPEDDDQWHKTMGATPLKVYRFDLDPPRFKTLKDGRWDASKPENLRWHNEWFVKDLPCVATYTGTSAMTLLRGLFSKDPMQRALAYQDIVWYFGAYEFDQEPLEMTEDEAYVRYAEEMKV